MSEISNVEQHTIIEGEGPFSTNKGTLSTFLVHVISVTIRNSPPHYHNDGRHVYLIREGRRFEYPKPRKNRRDIDPDYYLDSDYFNPDCPERMSTPQPNTGNLSRVRRIIRDVSRHQNAFSSPV